MNQHTRDRIEVFTELGLRLDESIGGRRFSEVAANATAENRWFSLSDIAAAVSAIRSQMLDRDRLTQWVKKYPIPHQPQLRNVGIIMAGNIPLVGFFDMLCVVVSGNRAIVKPSSKDAVLIEYIIAQLRDIDPQIAISEYSENRKLDAVIATGSDNTNRYFRSRYAGIPSLLRGSRTSVAVLRNDQPESDLRKLSDDIFTYSGLGCRNVSTIFVPPGFDVARFAGILSRRDDINPKYLNNFTLQRALKTMNGDDFIDGGFFTLSEREESPADLSDISYRFYEKPEDVTQWLSENDESIQCIVTDSITHPRRVDFGSAQSPSLSDYPDGVDVMDFLCSL